MGLNDESERSLGFWTGFYLVCGFWNFWTLVLGVTIPVVGAAAVAFCAVQVYRFWFSTGGRR